MSSRPTDEFLREFAVVMTDKGVVAITDPQHIAIYKLLCAGSMRPSEISDRLGLPSSSLHFILDKMVDSGIIVRSKPDPAKKEVQYSVLALKIAASSLPDSEAVAASRKAFSSPPSGYTGLSAVSNMMEAYTAEIGLDLSQLRERYVSDLADAVRDDVGTGGLEGVMDSVISKFRSLTGYKLDVFSLNPLTAVIEGDEAMRSRMDMLSGLLAAMVGNASSRHFAPASIEDFSSGDAVRYKVSFERTEPRSSPYVNTTLPQTAEPEKFMILDIDGGAALLMNDIQTRLVDAIYERPLCVSDIVTDLGMPRSTVTTNLLRMVEEGIVSVFYSESGSVYYGLSCSILMKRVRRASRDQSPTRAAVRAASVDGGFVGGYLLYMQASLQELGFDTDYLMVVLGAKYMRAAGADGPKNFDFYFGKMSDIAKVFGLSLGVASVYPLTIGISRENGDSSIAPAMTFVKGMAHQGLEMASSGIFVRNSEEAGDDVRVSFKEIYPTLSMSPASQEDAAADAAAEPVRRKRTSSVRDALSIRKARSDGRPTRTVRYITGVVLVLMFAAIAVFSGNIGTDNTASVDSYELSVDSPSITVYDAFGDVIDTPCLVRGDEPLVFSVSAEPGCVVGTVSAGIAHPLSDLCTMTDKGLYSIVPVSDLRLTEVREIEVSGDGLTVSVYDFGRNVSMGYAASFDGYISSETYVEAAGSLWASVDAVVEISAADGSYVSSGTDCGAYLTVVDVRAWEVPDVRSEALPSNTVTVSIKGAAYDAGGFYANESMLVCKNREVSLGFIGTDGPVMITLVSGILEKEVRKDKATGAVVFSADRDSVLVCQPIDIY